MKIVKFKLQNLIFSYNQQMEEHWWMMYRGERFTYDKINSCCCWDPGDKAEFFTYFNAFSLKKWYKYTNVENVYLQLKCKGFFKFRFVEYYRSGKTIKGEPCEEYTYNLKEMTEIKIPVPQGNKGEMIGFEIKVIKQDKQLTKDKNNTNSRFCVESGGWYTYIDEKNINDVNISIATTTFKKEDFIKRNIDALEKKLFYSDEAAGKHIHMMIIDNGRTLDPEEYNSEHVKIIPNENVGGAGGFTRGMIESLDYAEFKPTHVLLMDDDVMVMSEAFVRTFSLLSLVKPEYNQRFISGAMLEMDQMNKQHEDVGYVHNDGSYGPNKKILEMHLKESVFENEEDIEFHKNSYAGWWYCCIPVSTIDMNKLPIPLFIRGDDVEYSVANNAEFLTLNGICIWHKGFAGKFNANLELYMVHRNSLIIQAMSGICKDIDFVKRIDKFFKSNLCRLAYNNCELLLDALEEFCNGPDFMNTPEGEKIMKAHAEKNEKMYPVEDVYSGKIEFDNIYRYEKTGLTEEEETLYKSTYNGQTTPDSMLNKDTTAIIAYDWFDDPAKQYMAEQILAVNPFNHTACLRKRDKKRFNELITRHRNIMDYYYENKEKIEESYRESAKSLKTESFWRKYLGL